ncbi:hypothetical protein SAMN02910275_00012 [Butyrivibrio sp. INlla18]|uniref:metallophosphoesterase n=1 Tax=Butyrivibrio sp. INlla18 TaxID=1520806 RepID=UPI000881CA17|nr:metallophosphoesterase [Butyrivibrio sp. INlla18]SDA37592.1 hypothetical protein SAMN02910275_00012 [Butyrivibrio sp. INlla18]
MKKGKVKKIVKFLISILLVLIGVTAWFEVPVTEQISIDGDGKIDGPVRFALVTDLHSCYYGKNQSQLTSMLEKGNVDAVLLSGDIFDDKIDDDNTKALIEAIAPKYPCYYVTGNHEYWSKREKEMKAYLESQGVVVLEGDSSTIEIRGNIIDICGVDDPTYMTEEEWTAQLDGADAASDSNHYRILLSHRPERVYVYERYSFDLVVCGHAHGGQWRIPFTKMGVMAPDQGRFPKLVEGTYEMENGSVIVISRGLARESTPYPRFFNHPEIVMIEIDSTK